MDVETDVRPDGVTVYVDDDAVGTVDRGWWDDWTARIENDPETCLAACMDRKGPDSPARR